MIHMNYLEALRYLVYCESRKLDAIDMWTIDIVTSAHDLGCKVKPHCFMKYVM